MRIIVNLMFMSITKSINNYITIWSNHPVILISTKLITNICLIKN